MQRTVKHIHRIILPVVFALIWGRALAGVAKPPFAHETLGVENGCFVESVCFYDHFQEIYGADPWVRVLQWGAKEGEEVVAGHAVAVFELQGRLWAWDINFGFKPLDVPPESREDIAQVMPPITAKYPGLVPEYPLYRYDSPQQPETHPPQVLATHEVRAFRDATLVGARLAAHRPVNVVQFSYWEDDEMKQSAAVVFIFGGRLFIYFPERGTIPFIMSPRSIVNLSQLRYAFNRVYPGASSLKSLNY
jgi:hypothetical protein